ncbi:MAG TPA: 23S rRNA (pseudouridine(1915)-N(3))-methyltransferase RlmH [Candidatus Eisenbergiella merdigallinarum]|uniref:Ribosomal RNA large subunit methyltransferase H n=1 Tax=Candidatus Eisenbergiella merdigallinarum TaxID=2838552 RepID=A0A9D2MNT0_9FIRM|nr:23S rRNA (pseudouridine(1915)-N(3))-methyltransferase RlmH [Candidatus Eisenbergiella merdigallinarum]
MKITVLAVGKVKEKFFRDALDEYRKRLSRYCRLEIVEVDDEQAPERLSPAQEEQIRDREGKALLKRIPPKAWCIALAIDGRKTDSPGFSRKLESLALAQKSHLVFLIGGSLGLSDEVQARADERISFSDMTFPHQLMRVILLEQIYRAFKISANEPYHK